MFGQKAFQLLMAGLASVLAVACGDGPADTSLRRPDPPTVGAGGMGGGAPTPFVSARVGPEGGSLTLPGLSVSVPPGAVAEGTLFSVTQGNVLPEDPAVASPVYRLEPHGVPFDKPVELTLELPGPVDDLVLYRIQEEGEEPERLDFRIDGNRITATVDHFCWCWWQSSYYSYPSCSSGYYGSYYSGCYDIDECASNNGGCDARTTCTNTPGSYTCGSCPAGTENAAVSSSGPRTCTSCPVGSYCGGTGAPRQSCGGSTWDHDANSATPCAPKSDCAAGSVIAGATDGTADRICAPCAEGTYGTALNAGSCTAWTVCQPGQSVASPGSRTSDRQCAPCAAGSFSDAVNAAQCRPWQDCDPGSYVMRAASAAVDRQCASCPEETYSESANTATCQPRDACAAGTERTAAGTATTPATCAACPPGSFCAGGTSPSLACASGTWDHDADAATACAPWSACAAGQYVAIEGSAVSDRSCTPCAAGAFSAGQNAAFCAIWTSCGPGQSVQAPGSATHDRTCAPCVSGTYNLQENALGCVPWQDCEAGTYVSNVPSVERDRTCATCANGAYSALPNQSACQAQGECAAGTEQTAAATATAPPTCSPCPAGTHCPGGALPRVTCDGGSWDADADPATPCVPQSDCGTGTYVAVAGSGTADRTCMACDDGTFSVGTNIAVCTDWAVCVPGQYVSIPGSTTSDRQCGECASGSSTTSPNAASCSAWTDCAPGTYVSEEPSGLRDRRCTPCGFATYSSQTNQSSCLPHGSCEAGTVLSAPGTLTSPVACFECQAGTYCAGGLAPRQNCDGESWDHDGSSVTACVAKSNCSAGQYVADEGGATADRTCAGCAQGTYSGSANALSCASWLVCAAGSFVSVPGSTTTNRQCAGCASGSFSATENVSACNAWSECAPGSHVAADASSSADRMCTACAAGTYTSLPNQSSCTPHADCPAGTELTMSGTTSAPNVCTTCPAGNYCPGAGASRQPCADGTWDHDATSATACTAQTTCVAGQHVVDAGSATADRSCAACGSAAFSTSSNATACAVWTTCNSGTYVSAAGTATTNRLCTECAVGYFSATQNATACSAWSVCPAGFYVGVAASEQSDRLCTACPAGHFNALLNAEACAVWTTCAADEVETTPGTETHDRACGPAGWTRQWSSTSYYNDEASAVAVDGEGNVYSAGYTEGHMFGTSAGGSDAWAKKLSPDGTLLWALQWGTSSLDVANGVAVDAAGNVYVIGSTAGSLAGTSAGSYDAFVRKIDPQGVAQWTRQWGTSGFEVGNDVAVDGLGNAYAVGMTNGSLAASNVGVTDIYVRKLSSAGDAISTWQWGSAGSDEPAAIRLDASGNLYVAGATSGALSGTSAGGYDAFVQKLSAAGAVSWTQQWGSTSFDGVSSLGVDASGNVYAAGETEGTLDGTSAGGVEAYLRKTSTTGNVLWTRQWGTPSHDYANGVAVSADGRVYVAGTTGGNLAGTNLGDWDLYLRQLNSDGSTLSTRQWGTSASDQATGAAVDLEGFVYISGLTSGSLGAPNTMGDLDAFAAKLNGEQ